MTPRLADFLHLEDAAHSSDTKLLAALEILTSTTEWDEIQQTLQEQQDLLLSEKALVFLCLSIAQLRLNDNSEAADLHEGYLYLLNIACTDGIAEASQHFKELLDASSEDTPGIPTPRKIELLTHALTYVQHESHPLLWGELHRERGYSFGQWLQDDTQEHQEQAINDLNAALTVLARKRVPLLWALAHSSRGLVYTERAQGKRDENLESAIADFDAALAVLTREKTPNEWAAVHFFRGDTYRERMQGELAENIEQVITDFTAALEVFTRDYVPEGWADICNKRGQAYLDRSKGEQAENLERAIADLSEALEVQTSENAPNDWALAHMRRGGAYLDRTRGEQDENVEQAIADFDTVLEAFTRAEIFTREKAPYEWASLRMHRGLAYTSRMQGVRAENVEQAIADFDAALEVFTREETPEDWAVTYLNRGYAYMSRIYGERVENLEQAIVDGNTALEILTREATPHHWALTHLNRGTAYMDRIRGERALNLEQAIADQNAALSVFTREKASFYWAMARSNRGLTHVQLTAQSIKEKRMEDVEEAIADFDAALEVVRWETHPREWAIIHTNRGTAYLSRSYGTEAENIEQALADFDMVLKALTPESLPHDWTLACLNRGYAYTQRIRGEKAENLEQAIADCDAALDMLKRETMPVHWQKGTYKNRGIAYLDRVYGEHSANIKQAIADFNAALAISTLDTDPRDYRDLHLNLAGVYEKLGQWREVHLALTEARKAMQRLIETANTTAGRTNILGERGNSPLYVRDAQALLRCEPPDLEAAACILEEGRAKSLRVSLDLDSINPAHTTTLAAHTRAQVFLRARQAWLNSQRQLAEALEHQLQSSGQDIYQEIQHLLGEIEHGRSGYYAANEQEAEIGRIQHQLDSAVRAFVATRNTLRQSRSDTSSKSNAEINAAYDALVEIATMYYRLTEQVGKKHQPSEQASEVARLRQQVETIHLSFLQARDAIRQYDDPSFLITEPTLDEIARAVTSYDAALVYLAAGEESGLALIVTRTPDEKPKLLHVHLPKFTRSAILAIQLTTGETYVEQPMQTYGGMVETPLLTGGLWIAQLNGTLQYLYMWGTSLREAIQKLPDGSGFQLAALRLVNNWASDPQRQHFADQPFLALNEEDALSVAAAFNSAVISVELGKSLQTLGELGLNRLARTLRAQGIRNVTLIPYGNLGLFPLPAVLVRLADGTTRRLGETFEVTLAPSARSAEIAQQNARLSRKERPLILTAGNPQPLPNSLPELPFAAAEADTARRVAKGHGYSPASIRYLRPRETTREQVVEALEQAWYAHLALHGQHQLDAPRRSRLVLAGNEYISEAERSIYLSEVLDGTVNLKGLRLLILSACETALIDASHVPNEVVGLATGFLQAGAAAVIASLWAVDDRASYLLMSRFAQLYLDPQQTWSPACALAEAQRWLREDATNRVLMTYDPVPKGVRTITTDTPALAEQLSVSSGLRSLRYKHQSALDAIKERSKDEALDALPYADPFYWAGFVVTGC